MREGGVSNKVLSWLGNPKTWMAAGSIALLAGFSAWIAVMIKRHEEYKKTGVLAATGYGAYRTYKTSKEGLAYSRGIAKSFGKAQLKILQDPNLPLNINEKIRAYSLINDAHQATLLSGNEIFLTPHIHPDRIEMITNDLNREIESLNRELSSIFGDSKRLSEFYGEVIRDILPEDALPPELRT